MLPGQRGYLSQGRGWLSSRGTTVEVLWPVSQHMACSSSSLVPGSSGASRRLTMPLTTSSICREGGRICHLPPPPAQASPQTQSEFWGATSRWAEATKVTPEVGAKVGSNVFQPHPTPKEETRVTQETKVLTADAKSTHEALASLGDSWQRLWQDPRARI